MTQATTWTATYLIVDPERRARRRRTTIWERRWKASADIYLLPLASGLIAGEALVAVFAAIFLYLIGG